MEAEEIVLEATEAKSFISLENGAYPATITAIEPADGQYGPQVKFDFTLDNAKTEDGEPVVLWGWCSQKLNPRTKLFEWYTTVMGKAPVVGQAHKLSEMMGRKCRVVVEKEETDDGPRTRVTGVWGPAKNSGSADACSQCQADVSYFDADGTPFCDGHGPRGGGAQ